MKIQMSLFIEFVELFACCGAQETEPNASLHAPFGMLDLASYGEEGERDKGSRTRARACRAGRALITKAHPADRGNEFPQGDATQGAI